MIPTISQSLIISIISATTGMASSEFIITNYGKMFNAMPPKPFSCDFCLSFWLGLGLSLYSSLDPIVSVYLGCTAAIVSVFINKISKL